MKLIIIAASALLTGCVALHSDPCVDLPVKNKSAIAHGERVYGYTKEEFAAMPKYCGAPKRPVIVDRNGRIIGTIR